MIIGNGLVARSLAQYKDDPEVLIFASGVSKSGERNPAEFAREQDLLNQYLHRPECLVYFSSCSIFDPSLQESPYVQHKQRLEALIREREGDYRIIRLPNLVGCTDNPHTLFNFFRHRLLQEEEITVYEGACRYLLDADDLSWIVELLLKGEGRLSINACFDSQIGMRDLLRLMEHHVGKKAKALPVKKGSCYAVDLSEFSALLQQHGRSVKVSEYNRMLVEKYG